MKENMKLRIASMLLALVTLLCATPVAAAADYSDVAEDAWYYESANYVTEHGLMSGVGNGAFSPDTNMNRAMLVTVLHRLEGAPEITGNGNFSDVPDGSWYTSAVSWAASNQIVSGIGGGRFDPNGVLTREQLVTILYRYANMKSYDTSVSADLDDFSDAAIVSGYAAQAMRWAVGNQIISGVGGGRLEPQGSATRAQTAAMLMRFMQNIADSNTTLPIESEQPAETEQPDVGEEIRIKITVGDQELAATLEDNSTTQALLEKLPMTLPMMDLYGREMCYRYDEALPADNVQTRNFELGEIIYWPPRHSFVIMYRQDGEQFSMQHVGQIDSGVEIFEQTGDVTVTFELLSE